MKTLFFYIIYIFCFFNLSAQENISFIGQLNEDDTIRYFSSFLLDSEHNALVSGSYGRDRRSTGVIAQYNSELERDWINIIDEPDFSFLRDITKLDNGETVGILRASNPPDSNEIIKYDDFGKISWRKKFDIRDSIGNKFDLSSVYSSKIFELEGGELIYISSADNSLIRESALLFIKFDKNGENIFSKLIYKGESRGLAWTKRNENQISVLNTITEDPISSEGYLVETLFDLNGEKLDESKKLTIKTLVPDFQFFQTKEGDIFWSFGEFSEDSNQILPKLVKFNSEDYSVVWRDSSLSGLTTRWGVIDIENLDNGNIGLVCNVLQQGDNTSTLFVEYSNDGELLNTTAINPTDSLELILSGKITDESLTLLGVSKGISTGTSLTELFLYTKPINGLLSSTSTIEEIVRPLSVYPNPAQNVFYLDLSKIPNSNIEIYQSNGKKVHEIRKVSAGKIPVKRKGWKNGTYLIRVTSEDKKTYVGKVILD